MIDTLLVGHNDSDFGGYVKSVQALGVGSGAYKDLSLAFLNHEGHPYRALDFLSYCRFGEGKVLPRYHNLDFLWPTITYLGSYLHRHGLSFEYVNLFHRERDRFITRLQQQDVRTVAITTTLYVTPQPIIEIIEVVRQYAPGTKVIVGGPFVGNQTRSLSDRAVLELFKYLGADFYIDSNEGEAALVSLLKALRDGTDLAVIPNLAFRSGDGYIRNRAEIERNELADNLVNYALFSPREIGEFVSLRTAKSCPFSCAFCGFPQRAGKYLYNVTATVEQELDAIHALGTVTTLTFLDDTFNVPKKRFREILDLMIRKKYGFRWNSFYRSDHGDPEIIELMAKAGCEGVFLGIESGSDRQLERMKKTSRRRHYLDAIPRLRAAGISTYASLIVGFPGETAETVDESVDLIETAAPDFFRAQLWYADPITPIWERRAEFGVTGEAFNWAHNTMDSAEACRHIDRLFMSVRNSVWMPQNGFEQWSTFYLQRRGYSLEQIKGFVRAFNDGIKEKLLFGEDVNVSPPVLEMLKQSSDPRNVPSLSSSPYDASVYSNVVASWLRTIGPEWPVLKPRHATLGAPGGKWISVVCPVTRACFDGIDSGQANGDVAWLVVLAIALQRLDGDGRLPVLAALEDRQDLLPVPVAIDDNARFSDAVRDVASAYETAKAGRIFHMQPVQNLYGLSSDRPAFEVAIRTVAERMVEAAAPEGARLVLELRADQVVLLGLEEQLGAANLGILGNYIARLAEDASRDPHLVIEEIGLATQSVAPSSSDAVANFDF